MNNEIHNRVFDDEKVIYINFDTININGSTTPFNCIAPLEIPLKDKIKSIELIDIQIPIGFYNIRSPYNTFTFLQTTPPTNQNISRTATIPVGNYNISTLVTALQTAINAVLFAATFLVSYSSVTNLINISTNPAVSIIISPNFSVFSNVICGFTQSQTGTSITASYPFNLNYDLYLFLSLDNIKTDFINKYACSFKIPINVNNGNILFYNEIIRGDHQIMINNFVSLSYFQISVRDRFGNIIDNNNLDFSFKLRIVL